MGPGETEEGRQRIQVVGLGQVCVDYVGRVERHPPEDSKTELEGFYTSCGGPAATAMVTLARAGIRTAFLGSISDDPFGVEIVDALTREGVDISGLKITPGCASQFAFISVTRNDGKRTIFWRRSSAPDLSPAEVSLRPFPTARILHVDGLMLDAAIEASLEGRRRGMMVVMDAGTLRDKTLELVRRVDVLIASETFAEAFMGAHESYQTSLEELRKLGPRQAVITLGAQGSIGLDHRGFHRQPPFPVVSRDTTGAGDVYHGGYIFGLLQGWDMADCMAFASAAAALKCQNGGGWAGIPDLKAVTQFMNHQALPTEG